MSRESFGKPELTFKIAWQFDKERQSQRQNWEENNVLTLGSLQKVQKGDVSRKGSKAQSLEFTKATCRAAWIGTSSKKPNTLKNIQALHCVTLTSTDLQTLADHEQLGREDITSTICARYSSQEQRTRFQQEINELSAWKQMEHLLILSCTQVYKPVFCQRQWW